MHFDPIKPTLKAPKTKRLKLKSDESTSNFAFKFTLRRYNKAAALSAAADQQAAALDQQQQHLLGRSCRISGAKP